MKIQTSSILLDEVNESNISLTLLIWRYLYGDKPKEWGKRLKMILHLIRNKSGKSQLWINNFTWSLSMLYFKCCDLDILERIWLLHILIK